MKLNDFLDVLDLDTFIKIRWSHQEELSFEYVGSADGFYVRDEDLIVKNVSVNQDELIIVICVNDEED